MVNTPSSVTALRSVFWLKHDRRSIFISNIIMHFCLDIIRVPTWKFFLFSVIGYRRDVTGTENIKVNFCPFRNYRITYTDSLKISVHIFFFVVFLYFIVFNVISTRVKGIFSFSFQTPYFMFETDKIRCIVLLFYSVGTSFLLPNVWFYFVSL